MSVPVFLYQQILQRICEMASKTSEGKQVSLSHHVFEIRDSFDVIATHKHLNIYFFIVEK